MNRPWYEIEPKDAGTEADHLIRILDRLQCADLPQGGGQ